MGILNILLRRLNYFNFLYYIFICFFLFIYNCKKEIIKNENKLKYPKIKDIISSSSFSKQYHQYQLFDGKADTAWCEGKFNDPGFDEFVKITFSEKIKFNKLKIINGFAKSNSSLKNNWQVKILKINIFDNKFIVSSLTLNLKQNIHSDNFQMPQIIDLNNDFEGNSIELIIKDVYINNNDNSKDLCISEIDFGFNSWYSSYIFWYSMDKSDLDLFNEKYNFSTKYELYYLNKLLSNREWEPGCAHPGSISGPFYYFFQNYTYDFYNPFAYAEQGDMVLLHHRGRFELNGVDLILYTFEEFYLTGGNFIFHPSLGDARENSTKILKKYKIPKTIKLVIKECNCGTSTTNIDCILLNNTPWGWGNENRGPIKLKR